MNYIYETEDNENGISMAVRRIASRRAIVESRINGVVVKEKDFDLTQDWWAGPDALDLSDMWAFAKGAAEEAE